MHSTASAAIIDRCLRENIGYLCSESTCRVEYTAEVEIHN
jgi:hypothetical protein